MRVYLKLTSNTGPCPFNYQQNLVGAFHKWVGRNTIHDDVSLYSLSGLSRGRVKARKYLDFENGAVWFISSFDEKLIKRLIEGIQKDPSVAFGMEVCEITIKQTPQFSTHEIFKVASPVFIKRQTEEGTIHYSFEQEESGQFLTETLKRKLREAGLPDDDIEVKFDRSYPRAKMKVVRFKETKNKGNVCPVILKGSPESIAFAWNVGVGNGTGICFGALV